MNTFPQPLSELIRQAIKTQDGLLSFADFMELALYHPELGYYNAPTFEFGEKGDFTTAPEISPLYATCLAKQCAQILNHLPAKQIVEFGAGSGMLARHLLYALEQGHCIPERYFIIEISASLRKKQQAYLQAHCKTLFDRIVWVDSVPKDFVGVMIANEVLDAIPTHCFTVENNQINERFVAWDEQQFIWRTGAPRLKTLAEQLTVLHQRFHFSDGYSSEYNLRMPAFVQSAIHALSRGVLLIMDYGYGQQEYYHPERRHGTLTCFYQHTQHNNPLLRPGLQDITAHVDFTRVIEAADACGAELLGYTTQTSFLLACDLMAAVAKEESKLSTTDQIGLHQGIKLLTMPTEMGERVKVMALGKGMELSLLGFELQDRTRDL